MTSPRQSRVLFLKLLLSKLTIAVPLLTALVFGGCLYVQQVLHLSPGESTRELALGVALYVTVAATLTAVLAWWRSHLRLSDVQALVVAALEIRDGTPGVVMNPAVTEELSELAHAFNALVASLRQSQAERVAADQSFQRMFEALPVPASLYKGDLTSIVQANEAFCRYYDKTREQLLGHMLSDYGLGLTAAARPGYVDPLKERGFVYNYEAEVHAPGSELRRVVTSAELIDLGGVQYMLSFQLDVTDRFRAEQALREREQQLAGIVQSAQDGIVTVDSSGRIIVFNEAASHMFAVDLAQALGSSPEKILPPELCEMLLVEALQGLQPGQRRPSRRIEVAGRQGGKFPLDVALSSAASGERRTCTAVIRDLTDREFAEAALLESAKAIAANEAKTQFLSRMSHELRTPLNAVLGFAQLLREGARAQLQPGQMRQLELICDAGEQLTGLIDDILDLARIEAGAVAVTPESVSLGDAVTDAVHVCEALAGNNKVSVRALTDEESALCVRADPLRLRQVLMNLTSNAIKYNRFRGIVKFSARCEDEHVVLLVEDTGQGMSPEQLKHAFEPFNRLGREHSGIPGTGIGLALCRQLVDVMGGSIDIRSRAGLGTRVTLTLPRAVVAPAQAPYVAHSVSTGATEDGPGPTGTIVYVEDVPMNAALVQALVARWKGIDLVVAANGAEGLAAVREHRPALVLLDMHLPDMSGLEVLRQLRADEELSATPVVCLSADAMPDDVALARDRGADDYWTKPIDFAVFRDGVQHWLGR